MCSTGWWKACSAHRRWRLTRHRNGRRWYKTLREHPYILVWDNFESAAGIPGTPLEARLPAEDRDALRTFLARAARRAQQGDHHQPQPGKLARPEQLLCAAHRRVAGRGTLGICAAILRDLGRSADQNDPGLVELMNLLDGHPLAMRVMLPRLGELSATALVEKLRGRLHELEGHDDPLQARLFAALGFATEALPAELQPLLVPLALHERFVDADLPGVHGATGRQPVRPGGHRPLHEYAGNRRPAARPGTRGVRNAPGPDRLSAGSVAGRSGRRPAGRLAAGVCGCDGALADILAPKELHEQRVPFHLHGANFHTALAEAEALGMDTHFAALTQALGAYAQNSGILPARSAVLRRWRNIASNAVMQKTKPALITSWG